MRARSFCLVSSVVTAVFLPTKWCGASIICYAILNFKNTKEKKTQNQLKRNIEEKKHTEMVVLLGRD